MIIAYFKLVDSNNNLVTEFDFYADLATKLPKLGLLELDRNNGIARIFPAPGVTIVKRYTLEKHTSTGMSEIDFVNEACKDALRNLIARSGYKLFKMMYGDDI